MKKIKFRTCSVFLLVLLLMAGIGIFIFKMFTSGGQWVVFPSNGNVFQNGRLSVGTVIDRDGVTLAKISEGKVTYAEDEAVRRSTLHIVGDYEGNVAGGALSIFRKELTGYDFINGVYSYSGSGGEVRLSVSSELNRAAYSALSGRNGAVCVMNYETGEILCMVSSPNFDPENPPLISEDDTSGVYINRAIGASYTPGSVYKLVTLTAAVEKIDDLFERNFHCDGTMELGDGTIVCTAAHGDMKIEDALAKSCNCVFASLAIELGGDIMAEYAEKMGFTDGFYIDGYKTADGRFDIGEEGSANLGWSGAGQFNDLISPISMLRYCAAIANSGTAPGITMLKNGKGSNERVISQSTAEKLGDMMNYCVYLTYGKDNFPFDDVCAKSGTAEVGGGAKPHSWFTGFVRDEDYPIAFTVVIENGGWGFSQAGAAASDVLYAVKEYFDC